jgi:hypothetical protein
MNTTDQAQKDARNLRNKHAAEGYVLSHSPPPMVYMLIARSQKMTEADLHMEADLHTFNTAASSSCDTLSIHDARIDAHGRLAHELAEQNASSWLLSTRPSSSWKMSQPVDIHT